MASFLASDEASYVTGAVWPVDGGASMVSEAAHHILWTSGWDSTLCRRPGLDPRSHRKVRPHYLVGPSRLSTEIRARHHREAHYKAAGHTELLNLADTDGHPGHRSTTTPTDDPSDPHRAVFGWFRFPVLEMTKVQTGEPRLRGFGEVMEMTWFCRRPTRRVAPCGICGPCLETLEEGLGRRVPEVSRPRLLARKLDHRARRLTRRAMRVRRSTYHL